MKLKLLLVLILFSMVGFGQVKNYTIEGTKWVKTPKLILKNDTAKAKESGDTLLTTEKWRLLASGIKSGYDSSRLNLLDGFVYSYIAGVVVDSFSLDGRYKLLTDTSYNTACDDFTVTPPTVHANYPIVFDTTAYFHLIIPYYIDTVEGEVYEVPTMYSDLIKYTYGFDCNVSAETKYLRYWVSDSVGTSQIMSEHDYIYASDSSYIKSAVRAYLADSANLLYGSDTIPDNGIATKTDLRSIEPPVGGFANNLYFDTLNSDVVGYDILTYTPSVLTDEHSHTVNLSEGNKLIHTYLYPMEVAVDLMPAGLWSFKFYGRVDNTNGVTKIGIQYFARHTDNSETNLFTIFSDEINNITDQWIEWSITNPSYTLVATDRMGARVFLQTTRNTDVTVNYYIGDGYGAYLNNPNKIRHSQLRALNGDSNYLHVSSADTAGWNNKQESLTNPVTSPNAGVSGRLVAYTGSTTIDSINWQINGRNLGYGILPTSTFQIEGLGQTTPLMTISNDKNATKDSTVTVLANGSVGIGTNNPIQLFDIQKSISSTTSLGIQSITNKYNNYDANPTITYPVLSLVRSSKSGSTYPSIASFGVSRYENVSTNGRTQMDIKLCYGNNDFADSTILSLRSNGNIGIKNSNPLNKLTIGNNVSTFSGYVFSATSTDATLLLNATSTTGYSGLNMYENGVIGASFQYGNSGSALPGTFFFGNRGTGSTQIVSGATAIVRVTFANNGNMGIGTTTPLFKTSIVGSATTNNNLFHLVNSDVNKIRTTVAQACDTASLCATSTTTGSITLSIKDKAGAVQLQSDSTKLSVFGNEVSVYGKDLASMYMYDNTTACIIDNANVYHAVYNTFGNNDGVLPPVVDQTAFTYKAGIEYAVASIATYNGGAQIQCTVTAGHALLAGEPITLTNTTNYNGTYLVEAAGLTGTQFVVTKAYVSSQTGSVRRPATLKVLKTGYYHAEFSLGGTSVSANDVLRFELNKNIVPLDNIGRKVEWTTNNRMASAMGLVSCTAGDYIWLSVKNTSGTGDLTISSANVNIFRK